MGFTRIDTSDILDGTVQPGDANLSGSTIWSFQGGLSGSLQRTAAGLSYLVAGAGITVVSASNGQVTVATTAGAPLTTSAFIWNEAVTGSDGVVTSFTLAQAPGPSNSLRVHKNGLRMMSGTASDYVLTGTNGRTLTFNAGATPTSGSNIIADYITGF